MSRYILIDSVLGEGSHVVDTENNHVIPIGPDDDTWHAKEYRAWVEAGNEPLPANQEPPPDYIAFWDALTGTATYGAIRSAAMSSLPMNTLVTEFIALIGDAKAGRPNEGAIQASIEAILAVGSFTAAQKAEFSAALQAGHLESIYTLP